MLAEKALEHTLVDENFGKVFGKMSFKQGNKLKMDPMLCMKGYSEVYPKASAYYSTNFLGIWVVIMYNLREQTL